jgi:hypothetical protein
MRQVEKKVHTIRMVKAGLLFNQPITACKRQAKLDYLLGVCPAPAREPLWASFYIFGIEKWSPEPTQKNGA